jgi:hypothetical protein
MARSPGGAWEDAPEAWFSSLTGVGVRPGGCRSPGGSDVCAIPLNRRSSTSRRETGGWPSSGGEYPSGAAFEARCVSRIAAAVVPVGRPDKALGTVLGDDHTATTIAFIAERSSDFADGGLLLRRHRDGAARRRTGESFRGKATTRGGRL